SPQPALRTAGGNSPPVIVYGTDSGAQRRAAAPPPPPPGNSGVRLLLGVLAFAALCAGTWWLMRDKPVSAPVAAPSAPSPATAAPRFDLRGTPAVLFVDGDLPAALRRELTGSEQVIASEFMTRSPAELRAQVTPQLPHAALLSAWLALREGHSGDCIHDAQVAGADS